MTVSPPHRYEVELEDHGATGATLSAGLREPIAGGTPPEFDGSPYWWSPEHLLLSALGLCLSTTFKAVARKAKLGLGSYNSRIEGVLDKTADGYGFTSLRIEVHVAVAAGDRERAESLLAKAKKHCIVANALKTPVELETFVRVVGRDLVAQP